MSSPFVAGHSRCLPWLAGVALLLLASFGARAEELEIVRAERVTSEGSVAVKLPDQLKLAPGAPPPARATYRMTAAIAGPPRRLAIYMPGLWAHARITFNGHVIDDRLDKALEPLPTKLERMRLIEVPGEFVRSGDNVIEIEAAGPEQVSISPLFVGSRDTLESQYEMRVFGAVIGPAIVSVVVASVAICLLLIWGRRRDPLYAFFGLGSFTWALHTGWSVLPVNLVTRTNYVIWWTSLYSFFVAMLIIFCVRLAGWRWRRFDIALCAAALAAPVVLYAASSRGILAVAAQWWMLGWIGAVFVGVAGVVRYARMHRGSTAWLLSLTGTVALAFAVRDWLVDFRGDDNNPVWLVPYAGVLFVGLIAWLLIDRFVDASRELEVVNVELEQRADAKSAQLVQALRQLRLSKDTAEAANRSKSSFLAAASHDLRQPIHALGLYMAALAESRGAERDSIVQRMKASLAALEVMFNALLDVSRIDAGAVVPAIRPFALAGMLRRVTEEFALAADAKGLRLSLRVAPSPPECHALSDPMLVERIVRNLLANAVRYTEAGGVLLSCRLRHPGEALWRVEVWDTGPGIAASERERVFEEFYQVGNPERDRAGGLGLGLAIVRRLTDLLGLGIELNSRVGRGTRFSIDLPATDQALPSFVFEDLRDGLQGMAVAVVDDDPEVRDGMAVLLAQRGCRVRTGADADEVAASLHAAGIRLPSAVIADYRLRMGRTGVDAIHALRLRYGATLPALLVSGESSSEHLLAIQASGFECLSKPVAPALLLGWLARAAAFNEMQERVSASAASLTFALLP